MGYEILEEILRRNILFNNELDNKFVFYNTLMTDIYKIFDENNEFINSFPQLVINKIISLENHEQTIIKKLLYYKNDMDLMNLYIDLVKYIQKNIVSYFYMRKVLENKIMTTF